MRQRTALIGLVLVLAAGCAGSSESSSPAPGRPLSATVVSEPRVNLPIRLRVTGAQGLEVELGDVASASLDKAVMPSSGAVMMTWTPTEVGRQSVAVSAKGSPDVVPVEVTPRPPTASIPASASGRMAEVMPAGGQDQFITCAGRGGPTTVLVAGMWGWTKDWRRQLPALRRNGRVCSYDRPGLGRSPARTGTLDVDAGLHAQELYDLLLAAGERPPYLLVGHSYGGLIAQAFAAQHAESVQGMVLLDPVPVNFSQIWPDFGNTLTEGAPESTLDLPRSSGAAEAGRPLAGLPLILVSAAVAPSWLSSDGFAAWLQAQSDQVQGCADCLRWSATGADHQLQETAPAMTLRAIRTVRRAVRNEVPLKEMAR